MYNEKLLVSVHVVPNPVTALCFGRYGREDNTLISLTKSGMLDIKVEGGRWRCSHCTANPGWDAEAPNEP